MEFDEFMDVFRENCDNLGPDLMETFRREPFARWRSIESVLKELFADEIKNLPTKGKNYRLKANDIFHRFFEAYCQLHDLGYSKGRSDGSRYAKIEAKRMIEGISETY